MARGEKSSILIKEKRERMSLKEWHTSKTCDGPVSFRYLFFYVKGNYNKINSKKRENGMNKKTISLCKVRVSIIKERGHFGRKRDSQLLKTLYLWGS